MNQNSDDIKNFPAPNPGQKRRSRPPKKSQGDEILPSVKRQKKLPSIFFFQILIKIHYQIINSIHCFAMFLGGELKPFRVTKSGSNTYARLGLNFDLITSFENGSEMKTIESKSTISIKALEPKTENTVRNFQEICNLLWVMVYNSLIFFPKIFGLDSKMYSSSNSGFRPADDY